MVEARRDDPVGRSVGWLVRWCSYLTAIPVLPRLASFGFGNCIIFLSSSWPHLFGKRPPLTECLRSPSKTTIIQINLCPLTTITIYQHLANPISYPHSLAAATTLLSLLLSSATGKLLNGRQHLLEFKPVGDHHTPGGGDFRIRSAVLWLKVEHLTQQQERGTAQNVTIWIFNMKTGAGKDSFNSNTNCRVNHSESTTGTGENSSSGRVVRNCPSSEFANYEAADEEAKRQSAGDQELNLDEKVSVRANLFV